MNYIENFISFKNITILVVFALIFLLLKAGSLFKSNPYVGAKLLFTPAEAKFLRVLDLACSKQGKLRVFGKVRVADIIKMNPALKGKNFWKHFSKISQTHIDFVLVDKETLEIIAVVELDDSSHKTRQKADDVKNFAFHSSKIPLIRVPVKRSYEVDELISIINSEIASYEVIENKVK